MTGMGLRARLRSVVGSIRLAVAVEVEPGRCLALTGPSGAGKTTILRMLAGLEEPHDGAITVGGSEWLDTEAGVNLPPEQRRCGYLFQEYALFGHLNAWRNVAYGLDHLPRRTRRREAEALLARFGITGALVEQRPAQLSGGERQRVALARALAPRPRLLLLDEPLSALDARTRAAAGRELVAVLGSLEIPAVLVTHQFTEAALLADEVAVLDGGSIVQSGTAGRLTAEPASAFVADLTGASVLVGTVVQRDGAIVTVRLDGGSELRAVDRGARATGLVAVAVQPWDVTVELIGSRSEGSARNRIPAEIATVTPVGNRVRIGLALPQLIASEVTAEAAAELGLAPGRRVLATWKAAATQLLPR